MLSVLTLPLEIYSRLSLADAQGAYDQALPNPIGGKPRTRENLIKSKILVIGFYTCPGLPSLSGTHLPGSLMDESASCPPLARPFRTDGPDAHGLLVRLGRTCCFAQPLHCVGVTVVEEATGLGVQRPHRCHIFRAQIEIEDGEVFHDSFLTD